MFIKNNCEHKNERCFRSAALAFASLCVVLFKYDNAISSSSKYFFLDDSVFLTLRSFLELYGTLDRKHRCVRCIFEKTVNSEGVKSLRPDELRGCPKMLRKVLVVNHKILHIFI